MPKREAGSRTDPNGWMVTFSDLLNLLLTFFVLLMSMSAMDKQFIEKSLEFFGVGSGFGIGESARESRLWEDERLQLRRKILKELLALEQPEALDLERIPDELRGAVEVDVDSKNVVLRFASSLFFEPGRSTPTPEAERIIETISPVISKMGSPVEVRGYTDDRPISTAKFPSNWDLSIDRAVKIVRLLEAYGVDSKLLSAVGLAHLFPVADNSTPEGRARNRRVEIVIHTAEERDGV